MTSLAVTNQWLLATDQNGAVARYDLSANPITGETLPMIQDFSGRVVRQIRAGGGKAAAILHDFGGGGTDLLALIDPQAGTISSTGCQNAGQVIPSFALFEQRWAGRLHPMAIVVSSNGWQNNMLSSISLEDCATAPSWQPLNSINSTVAVDNGLLFLGYGVNGVSMLSMADLSTASMSTRFVGTEGAKFAKILGGFVYTSGENGTQIFQMH